ncbi:cationic amino acid transporter 4-like [Amphiura filiformis]|uniref:cationic amino acid transporter 4-like n=1 Tax=Amphiura filiformis TaxID=82378 RepID=UPI003B219997
MKVSFSFLRNLSRRKPIESGGKSELERCLTTTNLTVLGVGGMVGAGLYVLTGVVAKTTTGPSIIISFLIAGFVSLLSAICYAEFGCRIPKTGSAYIYTYVSVGEVWAFLIGWNLVLEYVVSAASVARAWSGYFDHLIDDKIRNFTIEYVLRGEVWDKPFIAEYPDIFGAVVLYIVVLVVACGASVSATATAVMLVVNCLVVAFVFVVGMIYADIDNWKVEGFAPYGFSGVIAGAATLFYAYVGFDIIAIAGEEALDQSKSIPRATYLTVAIATVMYLAVSVALTLMVPYTDISENSAFASAFAGHGIKWAQYVVGIGALCAMFTTLLGSLFCLPRSVYAMASDGILFASFARVNERTKVPVLACIVFGTVSAVLTIVFDIEALVEFLSIGVLMAYAIVSAAVIKVRYSPIGLALYALDTDTKDEQGSEFLDSKPKLEENGNSGEIKEPVPGSLKERHYHRFWFLAQYPPGQVVCICLMISVASQFVTILVASAAWEQLQEGTWWTVIIVIIGGCLAVVTFLPIPMHHQIDIKTGFKVPLSPWIPALSVLLNIILMLQLSFVTWIRFAIWVAVGLLIYGVYGYHHSVQGQLNQAEVGVTYRVLQPDESSEAFTGGLYGTIERQQPDRGESYEDIDDELNNVDDRHYAVGDTSKED